MKAGERHVVAHTKRLEIHDWQASYVFSARGQLAVSRRRATSVASASPCSVRE